MTEDPRNYMTISIKKKVDSNISGYSVPFSIILCYNSKCQRSIVYKTLPVKYIDRSKMFRIYHTRRALFICKETRVSVGPCG